MNDVKVNVGTPNSPPGGGSGKGITSTLPQPGNSSPLKETKAAANIQDVVKNEKPTQAESAQVAKENQNQPNKQVQEAVARLNDYIQSVQRDLEFNLDDDSGRVVVKVVDRNTNEVVRQIPDEMALELARNLQSEEPISLLNTKA